MGGPASSYATAGIALRVIGVLKPPHHDKVETPRGGAYKITKGKILLHKFNHEQKMPGNGFIARPPVISLSG
jgi:hypothetical protein